MDSLSQSTNYDHASKLFLRTTSIFVHHAEPINLADRHNVPDVIERIQHLTNKQVIRCEDEDTGGYWAIINATSLPVVPSYPTTRTHIPKPEDHIGMYHKPDWLSDEEPWRGFYNTYGANEGGRALSVLHIPNASISHALDKTSSGYWCLNASTVQAWQKLEENIHGLTLALSTDLTLAKIFPKDGIPSIRAPQSYGYSFHHETRDKAVTAVRKSRNSFNRHCAQLSWIFSFYRDPQGKSLHPLTRSIERSHSVFSEFYHDIKDSMVVDTRIGARAGYIVDLFNGHHWVKYLHLYAEAGVPIWIWYREDPAAEAECFQSPDDAAKAILKAWLPPHDKLLVAHAKLVMKMLRYVPPPPAVYQEHQVGSDTGVLPLVTSHAFINGDYKPGMDPDAFLRVKDDVLWRWRFSSLQTISSVEHVLSKGFGNMWRHSYFFMDIYSWECEGGQWFRRKVDPLIAKYLWSAFHPKQRYFCPVRDEWDLCRAFHEVPHSEQVDLCTAHDFDRAIPASNPINNDAHPPTQFPIEYETHAQGEDNHFPEAGPSPESPPSFSPECDSESDYGDDDAPAKSIMALKPRSVHPPAASVQVASLRTWDDVLKTRLGYDMSIPLARPSSLAPKAVEVPIGKALRYLGCSEFAASALSPDQAAGILDVVYTLLDKRHLDLRRLRMLLPSRWDLSPLVGLQDNPWFSSPHPRHLSKPALPDGMDAIKLKYHNKVGVEVCRWLLMMTGSPFHKQWWVMVVSGTTLMQICRSKVSGMLQIGRYLIQNGIPFSTAVAVGGNVSPQPRAIVRRGLGVWQEPEANKPAPVFGADRYGSYEARCRQFLTSSRGAIALRQGGVIWRLAKEYLTPKQVKVALSAPSASAYSHGTLLGTYGDYQLVDDRLEDHERDIILGAYSAKNGVVYLWPTEYAFDHSGINSGEWSAECESWFQRRLESLRAGQGAPLGSTTHRKNMRMVSQGRALWVKYETVVNDTYSS